MNWGRGKSIGLSPDQGLACLEGVFQTRWVVKDGTFSIDAEKAKYFVFVDTYRSEEGLCSCVPAFNAYFLFHPSHDNQQPFAAEFTWRNWFPEEVFFAPEALAAVYHSL